MASAPVVADVRQDVRQHYRRLIEAHVKKQELNGAESLSKSELKRRIGAVERRVQSKLCVKRMEEISCAQDLESALDAVLRTGELREEEKACENIENTCVTGERKDKPSPADQRPPPSATDAVAKHVPQLGRTELMLSALPGKDKYLGGVCARNGVVFGVPGHVRTLLRVDPKTDRCSQLPMMELMAPQLLGEAMDEVLMAGEEVSLASPDACGRKLLQLADLAKALATEGGEEKREITHRKNPLLKELKKALTKQVEKYSAAVRGVYKWLRGVCASDGCVYCIPSHSDFVLKVFPETDDIELLPIEGISVGAAPVWRCGGGVFYEEGAPLASWRAWTRELMRLAGLHGTSDSNEMPSASVIDERGFALSVLRRCAPVIDTCANCTDSYTTEPAPDSIWRWHGGVVAKDGHIYGIPCNGSQVLKIEVHKRKASLFGDVADIGGGVGKWYGGILGGDGNIYGIPQNGRRVLRINVVPRAGEDQQSADQIGPDLGEGGWKWHGGCLSPVDGCIYGIPNHSCEVLKIDPRTGSVTLHGSPEQIPAPQHRADGKYKYLGGVVSGLDGSVYCVPGDADRVLKIRPFAASSEPELTLIGRSFAAENNEQTRAIASNMVQNKWQNGFYAADGRIYAIPLKAETVLCVDPALEETDPENCVTTVPIDGAMADEEVEAARHGFNKWEGGVMGLDGTMYCMPLNCRYTLKITPGVATTRAASEAASIAARCPERGGNSNE